MVRKWVGLAAALIFFGLAAPLASAAQPVSPDAATATVDALVRQHQGSCGISLQDVSVQYVDDAGNTTVYARVERYGDLVTFAHFEVRPDGQAVATSPLAGAIVRDCPRRDPPTPQTFDDWRALPYFDYDSGQLYLTTTRAWHVNGGVRDSYPTGAATGELSAFEWGQRYEILWASHCSRQPQRVVFSRRVFLLGPPAALRVSLNALSIVPHQNSRNVVTKLNFVVNGTVVEATRDGGSADLGPKALAAFRYGENDLEIVARKGRSRPCNGGRKQLKVGVKMELSGRFANDLALADPSTFEGGGHTYTNGAGGRALFHVYNNGPDGSAGGRFHVQFSGPPLQLVVEQVTGPVVGCDPTAVVTPTQSPSVDCLLGPSAPGAVATIQIVYAPQLPAEPRSDYDVTWNWELLEPTWDANVSNNLDNAARTFCSRNSTQQGCQSAAPAGPPINF